MRTMRYYVAIDKATCDETFAANSYQTKDSRLSNFNLDYIFSVWSFSPLFVSVHNNAMTALNSTCFFFEALLCLESVFIYIYIHICPQSSINEILKQTKPKNTTCSSLPFDNLLVLNIDHSPREDVFKFNTARFIFYHLSVPSLSLSNNNNMLMQLHTESYHIRQHACFLPTNHITL